MAEASVDDKVFNFFSKYPRRTYPKGQILVFANENPKHIFYIVHGRVRKYDVSYRGDEIIVNIFKDNSYFPMSWAINKTPNHYFYKTETDTELHIVPAAVAVQFLKDNPDVIIDLLGRLYKGIDGLFGRMVHLMSGTARSRLLYELLIECKRFGKVQGDGAYHLQTNEIDMAARSGLSRETISREIKKLKEEGWIQNTRTSITVKDITLLEAALGNEL